MRKIILAGFGEPLLSLLETLLGEFKIIGIILDFDRKKSNPLFYEEIAKRNIAIYQFSDVSRFQIDAIVVINFNKIIDSNFVNDKIPILNIHMGLLPLYRGNFANAWSILNGDKNVGYTVHDVSDILDGGDIYYKFQYEIKEGETYFNAKKAISEDINNNFPSILNAILSGDLIGESQEDYQFIYASKLIPDDGIINWSENTEDILNKYMVFARPLGTGLKMKFQGGFVEISKISRILKFKEARGIHGAVVYKTKQGSVWVKTNNSAISIDEIIISGKIGKPSEVFKIGDRL